MKLLLLLLLSVIGLPRVFCQWNNNPVMNNVVADKLGFEDAISSVTDGANGSIVVYDYYSAAGSNSDIYAQKITASGVIEWGSAATPATICSGVADQSVADVIPDSTGGAFIAYREYMDGNTSIHLQHISSSGSLLWGINGIKINFSSEDAFLCRDGNGGVIVVWNYDNDTSNIQLYAQHYNSAGEPQWAINGIQVCTAPGFRAAISMVADKESGAIIFFLDTRNNINGTDYNYVSGHDLDNIDIYAQKLNGSGAAMWTANGSVVSAAPGNQSVDDNRAAIGDGSGGAIIVFDDGRNGNSAGNDIYAQKLNSSGAAQWLANGIAMSKSPGDKYTESVAEDGAGGVVASWVNDSDNHVYGQKINSAGVVNWLENGIQISLASFKSGGSQVVSDGLGNYIFSYADYDDNYNVFAQKINAAGNLQWGVNGTEVCSYPLGYRSSPNMVLSDNGGVILDWSDDRNQSTARDIYASKVLSSGVLSSSVSSNFVSNVDGNWNDPATWVGGVVPPVSAQVIIMNKVTVTANASCYSLKVESPAGNLVIATGINLTITN